MGLVYGFKALTQEHIEVVPKTVKEGNFAGFLLDLLEHIPDGTLRGLLLQEVGKVSCGSCHYRLIQASGRAEYEAYFEGGVLKTAIVLSAGYITKWMFR